jgi:hypothetical protein
MVKEAFMQAKMAALCAVLVLPGCGGSRKGGSRGGSDKAKGPDVMDCRTIKKKNLECLDVLVPMAEQNARSLMEKALARVEEPERAQLKARMLKAIEAQKDELKKTLKDGLKEPFMKWCTRAHRNRAQARVLAKVKGCMNKPDCKAYAQCLGRIMESIQDKLLTRTARPDGRARPEPR